MPLPGLQPAGVQGTKALHQQEGAKEEWGPTSGAIQQGVPTKVLRARYLAAAAALLNCDLKRAASQHTRSVRLDQGFASQNVFGGGRGVAGLRIEAGYGQAEKCFGSKATQASPHVTSTSAVTCTLCPFGFRSWLQGHSSHYQHFKQVP